MKRAYALVGAVAVSGLTAVVVALGGATGEAMPSGGSKPIVSDPVDRTLTAGEATLVRSAGPLTFSSRDGGLYVVRPARG